MKAKLDEQDCSKIVVTQNPQDHDMEYYLAKAYYACVVENKEFVWIEKGVKKPLLKVVDAPLTVKGCDLANTYISCGAFDGVEYILERL